MPVNSKTYHSLIEEIGRDVTLVAVSKIKPVSDIREMYDFGQRDFGENYVQELTEKESQLPGDIRWHFIGHLQSNKVRSIVPFVHLIQGVDSFKLLKEINRQAEKNHRIINCLLQVHIAREETKFGFSEDELQDLVRQLIAEPLDHILVKGLMGMASLTADTNQIKTEYQYLRNLYEKFSGLSVANFSFSILSMGMSGDYPLAIESGSTMVRIGSLLFGERVYPK